MINKIFIGLAVVALSALLMRTASAEEVQGGVKLPEPINARMETWRTHRAVYDNYTYVLDEEGKDTWDVYDGTKEFKGDCEDFAFTMQAIVGKGSVYKAYLPQGDEVEGQMVFPNHAVFIYAGIVYELNGSSFNIRRYEQDGVHIFFRLGDITPEVR